MADKEGADLVYVVCHPSAASVLKSYSPELVVYPYLIDTEDRFKEMLELLDRLHAVVIGPGLGRHPHTLRLVVRLILELKSKNMPMIVDAVRTCPCVHVRMDSISSASILI